MSTELITPGVAAALLRCPETAVRQWLRNGVITGLTVGGDVRIPRSEVRRMVRSPALHRARA